MSILQFTIVISQAEDPSKEPPDGLDQSHGPYGHCPPRRSEDQSIFSFNVYNDRYLVIVIFDKNNKGSLGEVWK